MKKRTYSKKRHMNRGIGTHILTGVLVMLVFFLGFVVVYYLLQNNPLPDWPWIDTITTTTP
jgi:hypothetical protein